MIQIDGLHFHYSKKHPLFRNLDLTLEPGKVHGLLGKNGTGKSTLLKLITGVLFPKEGSINLGDFQSGERIPEMLEDIFFLTEEYELPSISIQKFVKANAPFYKKFDVDQFYNFLSTFEVDASATLSKLSYGQKKKTLISFGLATNAKYLFMDEPTNGLDIPSKSQFRKALLAGLKEDQLVIISTHQIRDLNQLIESVTIIESGEIIFNKTVFDIENEIRFDKTLSEQNIDGSLYSEMVPGGYIHLLENSGQDITPVELEVLFNAVIKDKNKINQLFN